MASAALLEELTCSICLNIYNEPVSLRCGHSFCHDCIVNGLGKQEKTGVYFCPECRDEHLERPLLVKNRKLRNIVEHITSIQRETKVIFCTYCLDSSVAAVKTCAHCETSMCAEHVKAHNKTVNHMLTDPTTSLNARKCFTHKKLLEYYCLEDASCLCASCFLVGDHKGHQVEVLDEASEKKKARLRDVLTNLTSKRGAIEERILLTLDHKRRVQKRTNDERNRVISIFEESRRQLEVHEQRVLNEISKQEQQICESVTFLIQQLEAQKDELSRLMAHIEKLCNMDDKITVLLAPELDPDSQDIMEYSVSDLDDFIIVFTLHRSIADFIAYMKSKTEMTDLLLDAKSANHFVAISQDLKTASSSETYLVKAQSPERFTDYGQVMSVQRFTCGRQYWEAEVSDMGDWEVGVAYSSIERGGDESSFGDNKKSWSLRMSENEYAAYHNKFDWLIHPESPVQSLGLYLDYEDGRLSFYQLCDPIKHLYTFRTAFKEPLHAAFSMSDRAWVMIK